MNKHYKLLAVLSTAAAMSAATPALALSIPGSVSTVLAATAGWLTEEILQAMEEEIEKLPPRMREVLKAVYIDGLSYRETAEKFVISIATVKTLLVNALKRLRKVFSCFPRFFS